MRAHGNWCGPGWTAGQYKDAKDLTDADRNVPAVDALDEACKQHDIGLHDHPEKATELNQQFVSKVKGLGVKGYLFSLAVQAAGPSPSFSNMPKKSALRKNYENFLQAKKEKRARENMQNEDGYDIIVYDDDELTEQAVTISESLKGDTPAMVQETPIRPNKRKADTISPDDEKSVKRKFPWESLSNLTRDQTMDDGNEVQERSIAVGNGKSGQSSVTKETPILAHPPTYFLNETATVLMPVTFYFSGVCGTDSALDIKVGLNTIVNPLRTTLSLPGADVATGIGALYTPGLYNRKIVTSNNTIGIGNGSRVYNVASNDTSWGSGNYPLATNWSVNKRAFPNFLPAGNQPIPKMKNFYDNFYEFYSVINCDYQMTFSINPGIDFLNNDLLVASTIDTYADGKPVNNQAPTGQKLANVKQWQDIKWQALSAYNIYDSNSKYQVISGSYKPGSVKGLVLNDGDAKLWTPTNTDPTYKEDLHLLVFPHPLNTYHGSNLTTRTGDNSYTTANALATFNCECTLKYVVQFKDLKVALRYFADNGAAVPAPGFPLQLSLYTNLLNQAVHSGPL
jgi:hypothetical protein